jgi:hypothetical protein
MLLRCSTLWHAPINVLSTVAAVSCAEPQLPALHSCAAPHRVTLCPAHAQRLQVPSGCRSARQALPNWALAAQQERFLRLLRVAAAAHEFLCSLQLRHSCSRLVLRPLVVWLAEGWGCCLQGRCSCWTAC